VVERLLYTQDVGGSNPSPPTPLVRVGTLAGEQPQLRAKVTPIRSQNEKPSAAWAPAAGGIQVPANGGLVVKLLP
jgi:hypothetical protein